MSIKSLYRKERNRILSQIRKLKKQGFDTSGVKVPSIPKKVTEGSIRRLEKITTRSIQEKSTRVDTETGEILTARQAKVRASRERGYSRRKPKTTPVVKPQPKVTTSAPALSEWQALIDDIDELLQRIPFCDIPKYSKSCHDIMIDGFKNFISSVQYADKETKHNAIDTLRMIKSSGILHQGHYDSDDIAPSLEWASSIIQFGQMIKNDEVTKMGEDMLDQEEVLDTENPTEDEEWFTVDDEIAKDNPWLNMM